MQTTLDCLPCFLKQALYAARISTADPAVQKEILYRSMRLLAALDLSLTPPENSIPLYNLIAELSGCNDPFADLKKTSNDFALKLRPHLWEVINASDDPLLTAVKFAIAGNIIDYGAHHDFDADQAINACLEQQMIINDFDKFTRDIEKADTILYLGDNCGELVFDGLLIELIANTLRPDIKVTLALKERPIINDALIDDALACGIDRHCEVISNGTNCPGTPLELCSASFLDVFRKADLIISKGQGNYETLSGTAGPIYFLLTVKCPVVGANLAEQAAIDRSLPGNGEMVLMKCRKGGQIEDLTPDPA